SRAVAVRGRCARRRLPLGRARRHCRRRAALRGERVRSSGTHRRADLHGRDGALRAHAQGARMTALLGYWRLVSREDYDADGRRMIDPILGADPLGVLSFAPGHFAAQFSRRNRSDAAPVAATAAAANNSVAMNGYDAYFGRYTLDEDAGL